MAGFSTIASLADASVNGAQTWATWRKSPTQATTAGVWFDLSMSPGNPVPQYYIGAQITATALKQSTDGGLFHGANTTPAYKYLREVMALTTTATALPMPMILCDYLLFYPFIDEGTTDPQAMINVVPLPRYATGEGVQVIAVSVAGRTGGQSFSFTYTNSSGVAGRTSQTVLQNTVSVNGSIVTSAQASNGAVGPFVPLQIGDTGVRTIDTVTMLGGDVGLFCLVLVKPLFQTQIRGIDAPVETDLLLDRATLPRIVDDAYLNFLCLPQGTLAATALHGTIRTCWN